MNYCSTHMIPPHRWPLRQDDSIDASRSNATVLVNQLIQHHDKIDSKIAFWVNVVNQKDDNIPEDRKVASERIQEWYFQKMGHWYEGVELSIHPDQEATIQRLAQDENIAIKRIVEMAFRDVLLHVLRILPPSHHIMQMANPNGKASRKRNPKVQLASFYDEIFSGVDLIWSLPHGRSKFTSFWVKLVVTDDPALVTRFQLEDQVRCREFNVRYDNKNMLIPKIAVAISPARVAKFVDGYMNMVTQGTMPTNKQAFDLFSQIEGDRPDMTARSIVARIQNEVQALSQ